MLHYNISTVYSLNYLRYPPYPVNNSSLRKTKNISVSVEIYFESKSKNVPPCYVAAPATRLTYVIRHHRTSAAVKMFSNFRNYKNILFNFSTNAIFQRSYYEKYIVTNVLL